MSDWLSNATTYLQEHWAAWLTNIATGLFVLFVAWVVAGLAAAATRRALSRRRGAHSFAPMVSSGVRLSILVVGAVVAADQIGLDIAALIASAGVVGLAIGFGAQTLVKDLISGFFLVIEQVVEEGDWVDMDGKFGRVESIGLRMTKLRSFDGTLWHIPNGEVKLVGNMTREWVRAVARVGIAYEADLGRALTVLQGIGDEVAKEHADIIWDDEPPIAQGVLGLDDSSVGLRLVVRIKHDQSGRLWGLERELRRRVKERFDAEGIEIPFPRRVLYLRQDGMGQDASPPLDEREGEAMAG